MTLATTSSDPVAAISESDARGSTAEVFADIRDTLGVEVVNLIWRHLATMPGVLEWAWGTLKPLYQGAAAGHAAQVRQDLKLPSVTAFSDDTLTVAGLNPAARAQIRSVLDSYYHTNALALVAFSTLLARFDDGVEKPQAAILDPVPPAAQPRRRLGLPKLTPIADLDPPVARLVGELNGFGEQSDFVLVASMYRHLAHWPPYLSLVRTMLAPLHTSGELLWLAGAALEAGKSHGLALAPSLEVSQPPEGHACAALGAVRRFVEHPIARMTGLCALIRGATPI